MLFGCALRKCKFQQCYMTLLCSLHSSSWQPYFCSLHYFRVPRTKSYLVHQSSEDEVLLSLKRSALLLKFHPPMTSILQISWSFSFVLLLRKFLFLPLRADSACRLFGL
ncbi:hypothetical protein KP509_21G078900 [Ceratopteris richardii]|nr:hypothetical protein KP509_21G078900 [Ceratopteris richardii]